LIRDARFYAFVLVGMRRVVVLLVLVFVVAGCTTGHRDVVPPPPTTAPTPKEHAERLCRATVPDPGSLVGSYATTVGFIRSTTIATIGPTQLHQFPNLSRHHFAAWCWTRHGETYNIYKAAPGEKADLVARETGGQGPLSGGVPQIP
jgi:hypothetical protein